MRALSLKRWARAAVLALCAGGAAAAPVKISPVQLSLSAQAKSGLVTVKATGSAPARFEAKIFGWTQGTDGRMQLDPTQEVRIYPLVFEVQPGEERAVRVVAMVEATAQEKTYRLVLEQIPPSRAPGSAESSVSVLTNISVPVFLAPAEVTHKADVLELGVAGGHARFKLVNPGTVHFRPDDVRVALVDKAGKTLTQEKLHDWYVLAGGILDYDVKMPDQCQRARSLEVDVLLESGMLRKSVQVPAGACKP
jgi:fimbrial chaperone protein